MRQIFFSYPYFLPADPEPVRALFESAGTLRRVKKGEVLKRGGDEAKLFFLKSGLCAYQIDTTATGRTVFLALIPPGRAMGDLTASVNNKANTLTVALTNSVVWVTGPDEIARAMSDGRLPPDKEIANVIAKEECLIEAMTANFTLSPEVRLRVFLKAMLRTWNIDPEASTKELQLPLTLSAETMGCVLHLNRVSVAKIFSKWTAAGLARREGRRWWVSPELFDNLYDWVEHPGSGGVF